MIEGLLLQQRLDAVRDALRLLRRRQAVVAPLLAAAVVAGIMAWKGGFGWVHALWLVPAVTALWALAARWLAGRRRDSDLELARRVEIAEPELNARLLTAVEILNKRRAAGEQPAYLEQRVIGEALDHEDGDVWVESVTAGRLRSSARWATAAVYAFAAAMLWLTASLRHELAPAKPQTVTAADDVVPSASDGVPLTFQVTPGAVEVERDSRLVVEAKMQPHTPAEARLVWTDLAGVELGAAEMRLGVDAETFGAMIPRVTQDLQYRVEAGADRSESFAVTTFVYPKLERLDITITPPAYTGLPERAVRNTLKVTAPEFSELRFKAYVNKPVAQAELFGEDKTVIPLTPGAEGEQVLEGSLRLEKSGRYRLHLIDDKERANVKPPWITLTAQPNALAKIEVVFPKRDLQVSALQEMPVEARIWDDVGVTRSGATVTLAGKVKEVTFTHPVTAPNKKLDVRELLSLELEGAEPRQLLSYHFWAEDTGPKGEVRRAMSDMFFAQVRPFDDIFRESEPPPPSPGMPGEQQQAGKLMELQKQVVNANWRILRDVSAGRTMEQAVKDVAVVRESQGIVLEQTKEQMEEAEDAEIKTALTEAWKAMRDALDTLEKAEQDKQRAALTPALEHEQTALQWLYQAGEREHLVTRQNRNQQQSGGGQQERQEQIMNLELKQEEQRYEEENQAMAEQSPQQQENLEVLNRLKELARRQEALARKMQELRDQMASAQTEEERQELADQLQRLQQEQEDLLRSLDDLQDKLQQSDNAADLADTRERLDEARQQALDAAEELRGENLADAANSATRAQRELKQMEDEFREKTARRFSEEMRQMKRDAQEVAQAQQRISEALENQKTPEGAERGDTSGELERRLSGGEVAREIAEQQERVRDLLENMRNVSEQAEAGEPILSRRLYEAVRSAQSGGLEENLEEARMESRYGSRAEAQDAERKAATAVEQLARNVEKAAETVLGGEAEALRMARNELDRLIDEAEKEAAEAQPGSAGSEASGQEPSGENQAANTAGRGESGDQENRLASNERGTQPGGRGEEQEPGADAESQSGRGASSPEGRPSGDPNTPGQGRGEQRQQKRVAGGGQQPGEPGEPGSQPGREGDEGRGLAEAGDQRGQSGQNEQASREGGQESPGGQSPGQQPGQRGQGEAPSGQGEGQEGQAAGSGGQMAGGGQPQEGGPQTARGEGQGQEAGDAESQRSLAERGARRGGTDRVGGQDRRAGGGGGDTGGGWFFDEATTEEINRGPLTGDGYRDWADRLGIVEELLSDPELANEAARVADNARAMRIEHNRNNQPPQADELRMRITRPLAELRDRVMEELARKGAENPTVPIDRDPVPPNFRDLVRRYYTELGEGR